MTTMEMPSGGYSQKEMICPCHETLISQWCFPTRHRQKASLEIWKNSATE